MFLSIIVPVFNSEKYLSECLDSLLNQDMDTSDYEIVCIDDGSSDRSPEILNEYSRMCRNISVISNPHQGISCSRNAGISKAEGDYVWFVDSDDAIASRILGRMRTFLGEHCCDVLKFGAKVCFDSIGKEALNDPVIKPDTFANNVFVTRNVYRRSFILDNGIRFDPGLKTREDMLFNSEVFSLNPQTVKIEKCLYFYRQHSGSAVVSEQAASLTNLLELGICIHRRQLPLYFRCNAENRAEVADNLVVNACSAIYSVCKMDKLSYSQAYRRLIDEGLFFKRPKDCHWKHPGALSDGSLKALAYDYCYTHLTNKFFFHLTRTLYGLSHRIE